MASVKRAFRKTFKISKDRMNWFPGHMKASFTHMQAKMRSVDCIIEVHDSRIPFSGRNPNFVKNLLGSKHHVLVFSKADLVDRSNQSYIREKLESENCNNVIFVNSQDQKCEGLKSIIPLIINLLQKQPPQHFLNSLKYQLMVVGVPNVGKSTLINSLRNIILHRGKATAVGAVPGVTKSVLHEIKVSLNPPIYLIDTPGILIPNIKDPITGMKLALCSCIKDEVIGITTLADFLLFWMNNTENFVYLKYFNISEPTDEIIPLLIKIAIDNNKSKKIRNITNNSLEIVPDISFAAHHMVNLFRKGDFGDLNFDKEYFYS